MQHKLGFNRKLPLAHLDFALEHMLASGDVPSLALDTFLAAEIGGANRRRKAVAEIRELFLGTATKPLVPQAVALAKNKSLADSDRLAVYWSLFLVAFPFVAQAWTVTGRLAELAPKFTSHAFANRLTDIYGGGRTTLISISEVLGMMVDWGVIFRERPGVYHVAPRRSISKDSQRLLLMALCLAHDPQVVFLERFSDDQSLFPFRLHLSMADLRHAESQLHVSIQGDRQVVVEPWQAQPDTKKQIR